MNEMIFVYKHVSGDFINLANFGTMNNTTHPFESSPSVAEIIFTILMMFISLIGVVGNFFVIVAVIVNKKLRSSTNFLILNLSFADLFVCLVAIPIRVMTGIFPTLLLHIECPFILTLTIIFDGASRLNTLFIALERFAAIRWPFLYISFVTKRIILSIIFFGWVFMLNVGLLPVFGVGLKHNLTTTTMCFFFNNLTSEFVCFFVFGFCIVPLILIIPINCFLFRTSFRQMKKNYNQKANVGTIYPAYTAAAKSANGNFNIEIQSNTNTSVHIKIPERSFRRMVTQSKVAKMVGILIGTFVVLVTPISIIDLIQVMTNSIDVPPYIARTAVGMIYLNAAVNIFIYAGYNRDFRNTFQCMYKRAREQLPSDVGPVALVTGVKFNSSVTKDLQKYNIELLSFKTIHSIQ